VASSSDISARVKFRGAISGFGEVAASAHLPGWVSRPETGILAIHDPISERRHAAIRLIKNVRVYDRLDLMLAGEAPDFVDIASPPPFHAACARQVLGAGAHVLVEKPICLTLAEFDELRTLAAKQGRILMCVHNWKYAPPYAAARAAIDSGRLGAIRHVSLSRLRTAPAGAGASGGAWRSNSASGGGILIDHGWHIFYLMQWLMGAEAPLAVSAYLSTAAGAGAEDVADLRVRFRAERIATAHLSWRAPVRRTSAVIYGEKAIIEIEGDRILLTERTGSTHDLSVPDIPDDSYHSAWFGGMAAEFAAAMASGPGSRPAQQNLAEARVALALTIAARQSAAESGVEVALP